MFNKEKIIQIINEDGLFIDSFIFDAFVKNWKIDPIYEDEKGVEYYDELTIEKIKKGISQKAPSKCDVQLIDKEEVKPIDIGVEIPVVDVPVTGPEPQMDVEQIPEAEIRKIEEPVPQYASKPEVEPEPVSETEAQIIEEKNLEVPTDKAFDEIFEAAKSHEPVKEEPPIPASAATEAQPEISLPDANLPNASLPNDLPVKIQQEVEGQLQNITVDISNQTLAILAESIARKITSDVAQYLKESNFTEDTVKLVELKKDNELLIDKLEETMADNKILVQKIQELDEKKGGFIKLFGKFYIKK